jgi:hypothetical protein
LKTRIAGRCSDQPKLAAKFFQNVSIITALNAQKDKSMNLALDALLVKQIKI